MRRVPADWFMKESGQHEDTVTKNDICAAWADFFGRLGAPPWQVGIGGGRTNLMIGCQARQPALRRAPIGPLSPSTAAMCFNTKSTPYVQAILSRVFPDSWFIREVWGVDIMVAELGSVSLEPATVWEDSFKRGAWTTRAFVEHENNIGALGILSNTCKLLDFRADVPRIIIGYSVDPDDPCEEKSQGNGRGPNWKECWQRMLGSFDDKALDSVLVIAGLHPKSNRTPRKGAKPQYVETEVEAWHFFELTRNRLRPIIP